VFSLWTLSTRGTRHSLACGHCHPLRIASANTVIFGGRDIVEINLLVIIDCSIAGFNYFDSTEERVANKGWDNVDAVCRFLQIVVQVVDHGCCCCGSIWKMKGNVGADGRNALKVAAVSLTAKGMGPLRTP
jgi:hypothetical protein